MASPKTVDGYMAGVPEPHRRALEKVRKAIAAAVPQGTEAISWQMPSFKYRGRALVGYAAFKDHCSLFPMSGAVVERFADGSAAFSTSKGTIRFDPTRPLPASLVKEMVKARIAEVDARPPR